ncbi:MAG: flagellar motor protein MotD [Gammaproteobacteria bacterium]
MARRPKHEEHENHERWLVSYADFITLLFAFFVVMYSVSSVNEGKYRVLSDSLTAAFRVTPHSMAPVQVGNQKPAETSGELMIPGSSSLISLPVPVLASPTPPILPARETKDSKDAKDGPAARGVADSGQEASGQEASGQEASGQEASGQQASDTQPPDVAELPAGARPGSMMDEIADLLVEALSDMIRDDLISVRRDSRWLEVEINSSILFPSGSAQLAQTAAPMLKELADILAAFPNPLHVEGFTDTLPIRTAQFPSNWELSAARAASVVHLFARSGIAPERMAALGYGEYKPIADNGTPEGRAQNRRVVLVILAGEDPRWVRDTRQVGGLLTPASPGPRP